ncbi:polysaccharide biosynthesis protein [Maribrevibacterium harenarium]|uniref:Polysaccharide biosynthesis protein n=1 Tax=Maribrevibacterium harenarium TaxID=2589817 RepID=A0A501X170_9GAMM|nr:nucleoside-diphosphate sugar epimerase/dehydratase [Maribrevibacterium harenarium]TPE54281.1 polysaccharide biosynthesis protein [Maribrevibacterium harenarium]
MDKLLEGLFRLPRHWKRAISLLIDVCAISIAFWGAWVIRIDSPSVFYQEGNWVMLAVVLPVTILAFIKFGLYRAVLRYMGVKVAGAILAGIGISTFTLVMTGFFTGYPLPRTVPLLFAMLLLIFIAGSRFAVRAIVATAGRKSRERVVIYGAGSAGRQLAQALIHGNEYDPFAFIDDDENLHNTFVIGRPVYSFGHLKHMLNDTDIKQVLLAMPNIPRSQKSLILAKLEPLKVEVKSIPAMSDLVSGDAAIDQLRDVAIEDLLGREPVTPREDLMGQNITGKVVMVTGAGGSIGSELCRQILLQKPKVLVLFELSEFALYSIDGELNKLALKHGLQVEIKPIIGTVQKPNRVETVMRSFGVQTVYHAAAYKHVPLVEYNIVEGVRNNVFGTFYTAQAAANVGVERFVLVSTDKAVRPTNIMGTSKRVAELALQALAKRYDKTTFCMVRFGNVLGSSGSVVPLFREQIRKGGPVTVTHKDITRYFMTIPEASQLVIQAGAMGKGGDVFVLDMGESVKIADLARKMIHLMGLEVKDLNNPEGDIEIQFTGLRPGEKLYEELLIGDNVEATEHPRIMTAQEVSLEWEDFQLLLNALDESCHRFDIPAVQKLLLDAPTGYKPSSALCDLVWQQRGEDGAGDSVAVH